MYFDALRKQFVRTKEKTRIEELSSKKGDNRGSIRRADEKNKPVQGDLDLN